MACPVVRSVAADLLQRYLEVEEVFQADGAATEQEVIDALRKARRCCTPCVRSPSHDRRMLKYALNCHDHPCLPP